MKNIRNKDRTQNKYGIEYKPPTGASYEDDVSIRPPEGWQRKVPYIRKKLFSPQLCEDTEQFALPEKTVAPDFWGGTGLFIHGETGVGKTVFVANMILDVQKHLWLNFQYKDLLFTSIPEFEAKMIQSFDDPETHGKEWEILDRQKEVWLLVLDDLGVEGVPSDWFLKKLYLLINHRCQNKLPTIITSNLDLNGLAELYGDDRITSRIDRMCKVAHKSHWDAG